MNHFRFDPGTDLVTATAHHPDHGHLADFAGDSTYVECVYAGIVGPTALLAYRRILRTLGTSEQPVLIEVGELGAGLGVKRDVTLRALERLVGFRFAHWTANELSVHTRIPIIDSYHFARLSPGVRAEHFRLARELLVTG